MEHLASRLRYFDSSDFREAFNKQQQLTNPIDLSVGVPEELTAEHVKAAGIKAIQEDKTVYTPAGGIPELREAISKKLKAENKIDCSADCISVVPGLTTGQLLLYLAILDINDEVIVLDPYYPPYAHLASMIGAHVELTSTLPDFQPNLASIEAAITDRTKIIMINSPNNPTGAVYKEATLRKIAEIAERHKLLVVSDEIYEHFTYDSEHFSIGSIYPNTITMNGFSKAYAMTGWRLGYLCGPCEIIDAINQLQQYSVFSSSSIAQHAALEAISHSPDLRQKYKKKRDFLVANLRDLGYKVEGGQGAYYLYIKPPGGQTDIEFTKKALENNMIVVPGRSFSSSLTGFTRISYGSSMDVIKKSIGVFEKIR